MESTCEGERGPTPQLAGFCQGQDLERQLAGGISWRSRVPGQSFIGQKGLKNHHPSFCGD